MYIRRQTIFLFLLFAVFRSLAQQPETDKKLPARILILLDESSSMVENWGANKPRYKAAGEVILHLMDSIYTIDPDVEFGLRVFGHQFTVPEHNCYDTRREVMFSKDNRTQMMLRLADIHPLGVTPIAYALKEAAENDMTDETRYAYSIVLITDGGESCGGDICDVVKKLLEKKIYFKPYIVSLVDYAPLRTEYACLGHYLQATTEKEMVTTIDSIVKAFTPALTLTPKQYQKFIETGVPPAISSIPVPRISSSPRVEVTKTINVPSVITAPEPPPHVSINTIAFSLQRPLPGASYVPPYFAPVRIPGVVLPARAPELIPAINTKQPKPVIIANTKQDITPKTIEGTIAQPPVPKPVPLPPAPKPKPVVVAPKPKPKTVAVTTPPKKEEKFIPYGISSTDAKETIVEIFLEDGKGNFFSSTPQMAFIDPHTGNTVKTFYRTLDGNRYPDPQNVPPGTYNLMFLKSKRVAKGIVIEANKHNDVILTLHNGSLSFAYPNPDRPVSEFTAIVTHREMGGKQIKQNCTAVLEYEPGNYHISVNTMPPKEFNVDLDLDNETVIPIPEPGYIQFTNTNPLGKVQLYCVLGDQFLKFYTMDISGAPGTQKLQLLPGLYKVHFPKNAKMPTLSESVLDFRVDSNQTTELEIK
ncbi:MAG: VWA domain-containing protein [Taibaiella sp.]|nr:VWA domain-containing protein [Taibaiella sp.]